MSKTPRTDKIKMTALTERNYDKIECVPVELSYQLESELADKDRQLAEARAEIERLRSRNKILDTAIDEMTEEQAALCAEDQTITELVAAKDKLIKQMGRAMEKVIANYRVNLRDLTDFENKQAATLEAALAAERGGRMSKTPRTDEQILHHDNGNGHPSAFVFASFARELEAELAEARAEIERLSKRDGNAKHELVYDDGDNPFAREKLEHVDFGVADNNYVLESHLLNNTLEQIKAKNKLIKQMREALTEALQSADSEWENKNLGHDWKYACEQMRAALAAERGE